MATDDETKLEAAPEVPSSSVSLINSFSAPPFYVLEKIFFCLERILIFRDDSLTHAFFNSTFILFLGK